MTINVALKNELYKLKVFALEKDCLMLILSVDIGIEK